MWQGAVSWLPKCNADRTTLLKLCYWISYNLGVYILRKPKRSGIQELLNRVSLQLELEKVGLIWWFDDRHTSGFMVKVINMAGTYCIHWFDCLLPTHFAFHKDLSGFASTLLYLQVMQQRTKCSSFAITKIDRRKHSAPSRPPLLQLCGPNYTSALTSISVHTNDFWLNAGVIYTVGRCDAWHTMARIIKDHLCL